MTQSPLVKKAQALKNSRGTKQPSMPRANLKRTPKKIAEVEKKPLQIDPKALKPHPLLGRIGMLSDLIQRETAAGNKDGSKRHAHKAKAEELAEELTIIRESIRSQGVLDAIKICKDSKGGWLILDGRHRWELGAELGFETLPCKEHPESEARNIIMAAAVRRHISKGAMAYQAVTFYTEVAMEEKRGGDRSKLAKIANGLTREALASKIHVSPRTMDDAVWLFRAFAEREDARLKFEASIYTGSALPKIKGAVQAFLKGDTEADPEDERPNDPSNDKLLRCQVGLKGLLDTWRDWEKMKPTHQESAVTLICLSVKNSPPAIREALLTILTEEGEQA